MSDYLWDPQAEPDPQIERIERALRPHRSRPDAWRPRRRFRAPPLLAAAALLVAAVALYRNGDDAAPPAPADSVAHYALQTIEGTARVEGARGAPADALVAGSRVITDKASRARIRVGDIGSVVLEPESRLRIDETRETAQQDESSYSVHLERGSLRATIFSAPRLFQVGTPGGIAVDLGCIYTATIEPNGDTRLAVVVGAVSFETAGRKVYVPADAECIATREHGPGTPWFSASAPEFAAAVARLDRPGPLDESALRVVLDAEDAGSLLTLFHLLDHREAEVRERCWDRLKQRVALPPEIAARATPFADEAGRAELKELVEPAW